MLSAQRPEDVLVGRAPGGGLIFIVLFVLAIVVIWALLRGSGGEASPSPSPSLSPSLTPSASIVDPWSLHALRLFQG